MCKVIGIDMSKSTFDASFNSQTDWKYFKYDNYKKGFSAFLKHVGPDDLCVMEATGPYYLPLAFYLVEHQRKVSVVNPLVIKRFMQMRLVRAKTDKKDAKMIAMYGETESPDLWDAKDKELLKIQQAMTLFQGLSKQENQLKNQMEAFISSSIEDHMSLQCIKKLLKNIGEQKAKLEKRIEVSIKTHYKETYMLLRSIPGIGPKSAALLIVITQNFTRFDDYKKLISYIGFSPRIYQSGTSVRGKGHICKMGSSQIRKILYMATWSAKKYNKGCVEMYERLASRGKAERVIKVALANKLIKQAFTIVKSGTPYSKNYCSPWVA